MLKQLAVDGAVERVEGGYRATGAPWHYDGPHYDGIVATRRREADIMRAYTRGERCLMQLLTESLDDPEAAPCGRCSVCLGHVPDGLGEPVPPDTARAVAGALRSQSQVLEPRKMWPGGAAGRKGRIQPDLAAEPGRVLVFADAPGGRAPSGPREPPIRRRSPTSGTPPSPRCRAGATSGAPGPRSSPPCS